MNSYHNHIVDILAANICLSRTDLFIKLGSKNKKEFIAEVDRLIAENRIRRESDITGRAREVLSPKILKLVEFENRCNALTRTFNINYAPTAVLEKVLEFKKPVTDSDEDDLDVHLEIMGYKLEEKYKAFFEKENGITLDFNKFHYDLWAEFLFPKYEDNQASPASNIIYIDKEEEPSPLFIRKMSTQYLPDSTVHQFLNHNDACLFLENALESKNHIRLIILRNQSIASTLDFIQKFKQLITRFDEIYSALHIPVIILEEPGFENDLSTKQASPEPGFLFYPSNENEYILGNVMKSICENR